MIELVAFFGNPGREYSLNRHNAGFMLAEKLPFCTALSWQKKFKGHYAAIDRSRLNAFLPKSPASIAGSSSDSGSDSVSVPEDETPPRVHFIKPETFMNLSGESVSRAAAFFKIKSSAILVIHDELELPLGAISLKAGGGLGGHNGLRSMKACFGDADFWRIRIGIGRPDSRMPGEGGPAGSGRGIVGWVLSDFDADEEETLNRVLETAGNLLLSCLVNKPQTLLKEWAKKIIPPIEKEPPE